MNGAAPSAANSALAESEVAGSASRNLNRQRRNKPALIPSRRQNSDTDRPLPACRDNNRRHPAAPRLIRFL